MVASDAKNKTQLLMQNCIMMALEGFTKDRQPFKMVKLGYRQIRNQEMVRFLCAEMPGTLRWMVRERSYVLDTVPITTVDFLNV